MGVDRMKDMIVIIIVVGIFLIIGEYFLKRKLNVLKHEKMAPRAKRFETIGVSILFSGYLVISTTLIFGNEEVNVLFIVFPFFVILSTFRAFMEWRYNRHAKKWALEIYSIIAISVLVATLLARGDKFFG
jgi:Domain of unknown function (DUF4181)